MNPVDPPITAVREAVARALAEDLEPLGDVTSALLPPGQQATAAFVAREESVVAGGACARETFAQVDPSVEVEWAVDDGGATSDPCRAFSHRRTGVRNVNDARTGPDGAGSSLGRPRPRSRVAQCSSAVAV